MGLRSRQHPALTAALNLVIFVLSISPFLLGVGSFTALTVPGSSALVVPCACFSWSNHPPRKPKRCRQPAPRESYARVWFAGLRSASDDEEYNGLDDTRVVEQSELSESLKAELESSQPSKFMIMKEVGVRC
jgi:hypothetical protein